MEPSLLGPPTEAGNTAHLVLSFRLRRNSYLPWILPFLSRGYRTSRSYTDAVIPRPRKMESIYRQTHRGAGRLLSYQMPTSETEMRRRLPIRSGDKISPPGYLLYRAYQKELKA